MEAIIRSIFIGLHLDKKVKADWIKNRIFELTGHYPNKNHFQKAFLNVRENTKMPILKVYQMGTWYYLKSENPVYIRKHNGALTSDQKKKERRKLTFCS